MREIEQFKFRRVDDEHGEISVPDPTRFATIDGGILEAQFALEDGSFLIVTSDWDGFEAGLYLQLLGPELTPLDTVSLCAAYHTGEFRSLQTGPGESIEFSFYAEDRWRIAVRPKARWVFSGMFSPVRYASMIPGRHRLVVTRIR